MSKKKKKKWDQTEATIKGLRRANRELEFEVLGPGFHSKSKVWASKKEYKRKPKHKGSGYSFSFILN